MCQDDLYMDQINLLKFILSVAPPASLQGSKFPHVLSVRILSQNRKMVCPIQDLFS